MSELSKLISAILIIFICLCLIAIMVTLICVKIGERYEKIDKKIIGFYVVRYDNSFEYSSRDDCFGRIV